MATAPIWRSPFRPFFLFGAIYGPLLLTSWILSYTGLLPASWSNSGSFSLLYHQHELVFGFATAIIFGFIMTALPSWAGTLEVRGPQLALLAGSWVLGRLVVLLSPALPTVLVAAGDLVFIPLFIAIVGTGLRDVNMRFKLGLTVITAGFLFGNICYYLGAIQADSALLLQGVRIGLYAIIFHCSVTVGILAPIFTENALRENGRPAEIGHNITLEWFSAASILALAAADLGGLPGAVTGGLALVCALLHLARLARWRSLQVVNTPIAWVLHLGFAWLCLALLLFAAGDLGLEINTGSWVHAFTIGGFGLMSLGLMTRVSLKHTGRPLRVPSALVLAYFMLTVSALVRIFLTQPSGQAALLLLSALLWILPYLIYLALLGRMLASPSLPR